MTSSVFYALLLPLAAASTPCDIKPFTGHHCSISLTNLTSSKVTSADGCAAAVCAAGGGLDTSQWCAAGAGCSPVGCYGASISKQAPHNCPRTPGWVTSLVNYKPAPPPGPAPPPPVPAALRLPKVIDSGMVLQRAPAAARIWGWAAPGATVKLSLSPGGTSGTAVANSSTGAWSISLAPQPAGVGHTIAISSSAGGGAAITLKDIAFGDVFVCAGQSHMTFSVNQDMNGSTEIAASGAIGSGIRMLTVNTQTSTTPLDDIGGVKYKAASTWLPSEPGSFGTATFSYPSAICYYFAKNLYHRLNGTVPIGIVCASVGGSAIEFWQSDAARADKKCGGVDLDGACPPGASSAAGTAATEVATAAAYKSAGWTPSCFYNAMLHPLGNMVLRGFLWDQGEANSADDCAVYGCKLAALAGDLRNNLFRQPNILFSFDQLRSDPFAAGMGMQAYTAAIPHSMFSSRIDLQTCLPSDTSEGHAIRKLEVGRRLALAAMVKEYGQPATGLSFGPAIAAVDVAMASESGGPSTVTISLSYSEGLHHSDVPDCVGCCQGKNLQPNLIQGTPKTGDAWKFVLSDGTTVAPCVNQTGCTGQATILPGGKVELAVIHAKPITHVLYGGTGPWLADGGDADADAPGAPTPPAQEKCVYPHQPRFGIEACGLYNGGGSESKSFDDHLGIAMPAQFFKLP